MPKTANVDNTSLLILGAGVLHRVTQDVKPESLKKIKMVFFFLPLPI